MKLHHFIISVLAVAGLCAGCNEQSKISVNVLTPETTADLCSDHLDNDDNGKADCDEASCQKFEICGGTIKAEICDNWMDDDGGGDFAPGWYNGDYEAIEPGTTFIDAGTALWTAGDDGLSLSYAGQVWTAKSSIPLRVGYTAVSNPNAGAVDLTDILVGGYEGENMEVVVIQTLDNLGNAIDTYNWMDDNGGGDFEPGWYNGDYEPIEEGTVLVQPGEGLWVAGDDGLTLEFPATVL
jgi:hypothetical protein